MKECEAICHVIKNLPEGLTGLSWTISKWARATLSCLFCLSSATPCLQIPLSRACLPAAASKHHTTSCHASSFMLFLLSGASATLSPCRQHRQPLPEDGSQVPVLGSLPEFREIHLLYPFLPDSSASSFSPQLTPFPCYSEAGWGAPSFFSVQLAPLS